MLENSDVAGERVGYRFDHDVDTLQEPRRGSQARRERWSRRVAFTLMSGVIVAAVAGFLGGRQSPVTAPTGPTTLSVEYPNITRPGIEAPMEIRVRRDGGFQGPITVAIDAELFKKLDFQSWYPTPSSETADNRFVIYEFDPPPTGSTLVVVLDAHAQSSQRPSVDGHAVALPEDGAEVEVRMWVLP